MDNLVLTTVTMALDRALRGAALDDLRQETDNRFRLRWLTGGRARSTVVSMRPESPWIGRPCVRVLGKSSPMGRFAATLRKSLIGARLASVVKPCSGRVLEFRFADGRRLAFELAPHGANIVHMGPDGRVVSCLRTPRASRGRLEAGTSYVPPPRPAAIPDPREMTAGEIDARIAALAAEGEPALEGLRRHLFGVGSPAARLVVEESVASGESHGRILLRRLGQLSAGELEPVIAGDALWPWCPAHLAGGTRGADAAETAGRWYEERDREHRETLHRRSLLQIVRRERSRTHQALRRCEADVRGFDAPERHRRWAVALLAGLSRAERVGRDAVRVPDPEDPAGGDLVIPAAPGVALSAVAEKLFARHRRAVRGQARARERFEALTARVLELDALVRAFEAPGSEHDLVEEMRRLRLPVELLPATRAGRETSRREIPRAEGVRVYYASSGEMILAGKGAKENHRLTFKLAAPHDFWLHAAGVTGAHVVLRNDTRERRPPAVALAEAAAVAAFHSEASSERQVDVQWTQRKNVRKPRGASPGTVTVKRFETIRVRPGLISPEPDPIS